VRRLTPLQLRDGVIVAAVLALFAWIAIPHGPSQASAEQLGRAKAHEEAALAALARSDARGARLQRAADSAERTTSAKKFAALKQQGRYRGLVDSLTRAGRMRAIASAAAPDTGSGAAVVPLAVLQACDSALTLTERARDAAEGQVGVLQLQLAEAAEARSQIEARVAALEQQRAIWQARASPPWYKRFRPRPYIGAGGTVAPDGGRVSLGMQFGIGFPIGGGA
jgi:hypothetical protein